jgi:hypothetical protein
MASARQIAANRRNAKKSTGPKSELGKKRSSQNAFKHGLSVPTRGDHIEAQVQQLTREFGAGVRGPNIHTWSEKAARAAIQSARVREYKMALMESLLIDAHVGPTVREQKIDGLADSKLANEQSEDSSATLNHSVRRRGGADSGLDVENTAEKLTHLTEITRYERRAAGTWGRSIAKIASARKEL